MKNTIKSGFIGIITGFANGLFGAGGGTILVPSLQKFLNVECHKSHATAIAIIFPLSILSSFIYVRVGEIQWKVVLLISIGGIIGGGIGALTLKKIPKNMLHKIFGLFMIIAAVRMIF